MARQSLGSEAGWPLCVSDTGCSGKALPEGPAGFGAPLGWRGDLSSPWQQCQQPCALLQPVGPCRAQLLGGKQG